MYKTKQCLADKLYFERFDVVGLEYELWQMELEREAREIRCEMAEQGYE